MAIAYKTCIIVSPEIFEVAALQDLVSADVVGCSFLLFLQIEPLSRVCTDAVMRAGF